MATRKKTTRKKQMKKSTQKTASKKVSPTKKQAAKKTRAVSKKQAAPKSPKGIAFITGASSGIGAEYARVLASRGYDLAITARRKERLEALKKEVEKTYGVCVDVLAADLSKLSDIKRLEKYITKNDIRFLINNAGYGLSGHFSGQDINKVVDMLTVHDTASIRLTHAALPAMLQKNEGAVINVSSLVAFMPIAGSVMYSSTKGFLTNFTEALKEELKGTAIQTQVLCPGFTYSGFLDTKEYSKEFKEERLNKMKSMFMSAEEVVRQSLKALKKRSAIFIPGVKNRFSYMFLRTRLGLRLSQKFGAE